MRHVKLLDTVCKKFKSENISRDEKLSVKLSQHNFTIFFIAMKLLVQGHC